MEHVTVKDSRRRKVFTDGLESGFTNMTLHINRGTHVVTLSNPPNYEPVEDRVRVQNTNAIRPLNLRFERKDT